MASYMVFTTTAFILFFIVVVAAYLLARKATAKCIVLLVASYAFYAGFDWRFCGLLILTTLVDHFTASRIQRSGEKGARLRWLLLTLFVDLGILGAFKYLHFFTQSFVDLFGLFGLSVQAPEFEILMPLGISFYTFQSIGFVIDVYRGKRQAARHLSEYALFLAFFPKLLQGPIERGDLIERFRALPDGRRLVWSGLLLCVLGAFKKVVLADNLGAVANPIYDDVNPIHGPAMLMGMYLYTLQLYLDFSGYTDFARGIGRFLGVELSENFRSPYASDDPRDFWSRWHITLSSWLRDYLYVPLGGNRCSGRRRSFNLMATMLLGGLWHGAAWTFVIWGGYHGALLTVTHYLSRTKAYAVISANRLGVFAKRLATFHLVALGWVVFRCHDLTQVKHSLHGLLSIFSPSVWAAFAGVVAERDLHWRLSIWAGLMLMSVLLQNLCREGSDAFLERTLKGRAWLALLFITVAMVAIILWAPEMTPDFLYFQF